VILNEVSSINPTSLNGYTEIAGQKADMVIANPNGISINGAGFINTSSITLTTGRPTVLDGSIDSFNIVGGDIIPFKSKYIYVLCYNSIWQDR
jgi:filamentous hemagglutinin family protein